MAETDRMQEIRRRLAAVSWLPWETGDHWVYGDRGDGDLNRAIPNVLNEGRNGDAADCECSQRNVEFVAHAPADVEYLLAEVDRLRLELAQANAEVFTGWSV